MKNSGKDRKPWEWGKLYTAGHYFFNRNTLFFWLGDTAWLLLHNLKREDVQLYLRNRKEKGFTVIQMTAVHHLPAYNAYGKAAFQEGHPGLPAGEEPDGYWSMLEWVLSEAEKLGLYVALLPHWGNLAAEIPEKNMERYVDFLLRRYENAPNLIWVLGGDTRGDVHKEYWEKMGQRLKEGNPDRLLTFHPFGRTSSLDFFPEEDWMDFHMFQSGHRRYNQQVLSAWDDNRVDEKAERWYGEDNWRYVRDGYTQKKRCMPILDGEPSYEHIPQGLHLKTEPYWSGDQAARYGWWSLLAGAAGFTFGHNAIMQFYTGKEEGAFQVKIPWKDALHSPGSDKVCMMRKILEPLLGKYWKETEPGEGYLTKEAAWNGNQREERILGMRLGPCYLFYSYQGKPVILDTQKVVTAFWDRTEESGKVIEPLRMEAWWIDPRTGIRSYTGCRVPVGECLEYFPPRTEHADWLLLLQLQIGSRLS